MTGVALSGATRRDSIRDGRAAAIVWPAEHAEPPGPKIAPTSVKSLAKISSPLRLLVSLSTFDFQPTPHTTSWGKRMTAQNTTPPPGLPGKKHTAAFDTAAQIREIDEQQMQNLLQSAQRREPSLRSLPARESPVALTIGLRKRPESTIVTLSRSTRPSSTARVRRASTDGGGLRGERRTIFGQTQSNTQVRSDGGL